MNNQVLNPCSPFTLAFLRDSGQLRSTCFQIRRAVRAVVIRSGHLLLVHSTVNGEYKFPDGGARRGERHRDTLARELREETGYQLQAVNKLLGTTIEMDIPRLGEKQPFRMVSFYYLCEISPEKGALEHDAYEDELGFHPRWVTLPESLTNNELLMYTAAAERVFWLARETAVLQQLSTLFPGKSVL